MDQTQAKYSELLERVGELPGAVVAFSGGVDSSLLLAVAVSVLGERALAVTVVSELVHPEERARARRLAQELGAAHREVAVPLLGVKEVRENLPERCYYCKYAVLSPLVALAQAAGHGIVLEGSQLTDAGSYRPGERAVRALGVRSPLREVGLTKAEVRFLSRQLGLPSAALPASPCLATRFPYGVTITPERLFQVEQAESQLRRLGIGDLRLRHHGTVARLEVEPAGLALAWARRGELVSIIKGAGFTYAALDLQGYRSGSMDEALHVVTAEEEQ